jgi:hypothetical protein
MNETYKREFGQCFGCVFYDGGDGGWGDTCNVKNNGFDSRSQVSSRVKKVLPPCFDRRDINDMWKMLENDDGIKR